MLLKIIINQEPTPPPPPSKKKKSRNDLRRSTSASQPRAENGNNAWDDGYTVQGSIEGPISPVNYAGTQINIWGTPGGNLTEGLLSVADPNRNPNYGYMTEQMLQVGLCEQMNSNIFLIDSDCNKRRIQRLSHLEFEM